MVECASWENEHICYSNNLLMNYGLVLASCLFKNGPHQWSSFLVKKGLLKQKQKLKSKQLPDLCVFIKSGQIH